MKQLKTYDEILPYLFDSSDELQEQGKLSQAQLQIKERCAAIYSWKIADPLISDSEIAEQLSKKFEVTTRTLYNDLRAMETLICAVKKANKEYVRFLVTEQQKYAIKKEKELIEEGKDSTKDLSYAVSVLSKAHNLDEADPDTPEWDDFQTPDVDITDDVTVLDIEDMPDEEAERIKRRYLPAHNEDIEDADIVE
ncbi:MAG: hypothetical protein ACQER7_06285 [Bacteroidota bacterium]